MGEAFRLPGIERHVSDFPAGALCVFVATSREEVPSGCRRYASVDGSVPGAVVTWDHHRTGEPINLDAMPDVVDVAGLDGVGTTLADTDALVSVVAVLLGGKARLPPGVRTVFEAASHRCDHLAAHPRVDRAADEAGLGLHRFVTEALGAAPREAVSGTFAGLCRDLAGVVREGRPLPRAADSGSRSRDAERLDAEGRIRRREMVAVIDLRGRDPVPPDAIYARVGRPVGIFVADHRKGGVVYTVGVNPFVRNAPADLTPALAALARAEFSHGPPALAPTPLPGSENWGGRATVFGSPWNYGSRLAPDEVAAIVEAAIPG